MAGKNGNAPRTVEALIDRYRVHAEEYYQKRDKDGELRPTREAQTIRYATRALVAVAGDKNPADLVAEDLIAAQRWMIEQGYNRRVINGYVGKIRRAIRWAAHPPQRYIPASVYSEVQLVESLRPGRSKAPEPKRIQPVPWEHVARTLEHADARISAIIKVQWATGMRPSEVCSMRFSELQADERDPAASLVYIPAVHKTDAHVDRVIPIPRSGFEALKGWVALRWTSGDEIFAIQPGSYAATIRGINKRHGIPHWFPYQIRHALAVRLREEHGERGIDAARQILGHTTLQMTERYVTPQMGNAVDLLRQLDQGGGR